MCAPTELTTAEVEVDDVSVPDHDAMTVPSRIADAV